MLGAGDRHPNDIEVTDALNLVTGHRFSVIHNAKLGQLGVRGVEMLKAPDSAVSKTGVDCTARNPRVSLPQCRRRSV
jgi:hypothetical protein